MLKKLKLNSSMKTYKTFRINTPNRCPSYYSGLECKNRKSRNTWSNRQIWPGSTEWSRAKANRVLPRERTGHSKPSSNNTRKDSTHGHHQMVNTEIRLIIFFAAKDGEALYSQQKQDQELDYRNRHTDTHHRTHSHTKVPMAVLHVPDIKVKPCKM